MLRAIPLPAFDDNYIWLLAAPGGEALVVDPGEAGPVLQAAADGLRPVAIVLTHHHADHVGGAQSLRRDQLVGAGVPAASVVVSGYCTRCHQHLFHSHRGSGGKPGRLDAFVVRMPTPAAGDAGHPFSVRS